jgi:hypothetical protein
MGGNKVLIVAQTATALADGTAKGFVVESKIPLRLTYEPGEYKKAVATLKAVLRCNIENIAQVIIPLELYVLATKWSDPRHIHSPANALCMLIGRYTDISWRVYDEVENMLYRLQRHSLKLERETKRELVVADQ